MLSWKRFVKDIITFRKMMLLAVALFIVGIMIGAMNTGFITELITPQLEQLREQSQKLANSGNPEWNFFVFIFLNNAIKSILFMLAGALIGLLPIFFLIMNGMILGYLVTTVSLQGESLFDLIVRGLLPHGIIEIPAIIIAAAYGLQFGYYVLKALGEAGTRDPEDRTVKWREFFKALMRAGVWIVIMLFVAAIIESTLTFYLVKL